MGNLSVLQKRSTTKDDHDHDDEEEAEHDDEVDALPPREFIGGSRHTAEKRGLVGEAPSEPGLPALPRPWGETYRRVGVGRVGVWAFAQQPCPGRYGEETGSQGRITREAPVRTEPHPTNLRRLSQDSPTN